MMSFRRLQGGLASLSLLLLATGAAAAGSKSSETGAAARLREHVRILASDAFEGRLPATAGEEKTIAYVREQMTKIGLAPGGESVAGKKSWFQRVPLLSMRTDGPVEARLTDRGGTRSLEQGKDLVLRGSPVSPARVEVQKVPLVFIGYGVDAPEKKWDDYKGVDLRGKIAVFLFNDPDAESGGTEFEGKTMTRYGGPGHKIEQAVKRGAIGTLMIHEEKVFGYRWPTISEAMLQTRQDIVRPDAKAKYSVLEGVLAREATVSMFREAGLDFEALKKQAQTRDFRPVELAGLRFTGRYGVDRAEKESRSVIGILPGTSRPDETITFISHWDHQGMGPPDASGDRIYNGAMDNATGVGGLLEIARNLAARPRQERSTLFIAVTLEEPGILGSEYYAQNPIYPLEKTVAVIALDCMFPLGKARDFTNHAPNETELNDLLIEAGRRQGRRFTAGYHPEMFLRMRTDHAPFARRGVPPIFYGPGEDLIDGGFERSGKFIADYFSKHYHRQSDELSPDWDFSGIAQDTELLADLAARLANSRQWPEWKEGGEFKTLRDASADQRR